MVLSYPCHFRGCERYDLLQNAPGNFGSVLVVAGENQPIGDQTPLIKLVIAEIFLIYHAAVGFE